MSVIIDNGSIKLYDVQFWYGSQTYLLGVIIATLGDYYNYSLRVNNRSLLITMLSYDIQQASTQSSNISSTSFKFKTNGYWLETGSKYQFLNIICDISVSTFGYSCVINCWRSNKHCRHVKLYM